MIANEIKEKQAFKYVNFALKVLNDLTLRASLI